MIGVSEKPATATSRRRPTLSQRSRLADLLGGFDLKEGVTRSPLDGVKFMRVDRYCPRRPVMYEPSIVIVAQGRKRGYLGGKVYAYDASHYLVVALPLPFECETIPAPDGPMLGLKLRVDVHMLVDLILKAGQPPADDERLRPAIVSTDLDSALEDAAVRLVTCLSNPADTAVLGPQFVREITYRVLAGKNGQSLRALAAMHDKVWPLHRTLERLHERYAETMDVASLASSCAMSLSAFHHHFRRLTGTSPIQYVKTVRLQKARLLIAVDGLGAAEAALRVGYESPSQFNREFKRFFGLPPSTEAARLRQEWTEYGRVPPESILT